MIRLLVKKFLDDKNYKNKKEDKCTLNDVSAKTGISRATLNRIVNTQGFKTNTDAINALCHYFECTPCDLIEYTPDDDEKTEDSEKTVKENNKEK